MLDIRLIRENPQGVKERLARRGGGLEAQVDVVLEMDVERRHLETRLQQLNADKKRVSKEIGMRRSKGEDSAELEGQSRAIGEEISTINVQTGEADERQRDALLRIPNLPHPNAPVGKDAEDNPVVRTWGEKPKHTFPVLDHVQIGEKLKLLDFERATKISGSGFIVFTGLGARLERALIQYMLDLHTIEHGYTEVAPPYLVRRECMVGTSQLPKFEEDMYGLENGALFLAPTAEVPVTNLHREEILSPAELPKKFAAYTPCFRREAGSTGRENRGMIRVHQFDKVELVKITRPEVSYDELESLTANAETILQRLGLHYRVIELCTGDVGFGSAKTYDIEVWAPGQQAYLEVSSCSNFEDYQARRMGLRFKNEQGKNVFCHTLNGSGTALPRLWVALVETWQQADGTVVVPEPLRPYMKLDRIE